LESNLISAGVAEIGYVVKDHPVSRLRSFGVEFSLSGLSLCSPLLGPFLCHGKEFDIVIENLFFFSSF